MTDHEKTQRVLAISRNLDAHLATRFGNETPQVIFSALAVSAISIASDLQVPRKEFLHVMRDMFDEYNRHADYVQGTIACNQDHQWSDRIYNTPPVLRSNCPQCNRKAIRIIQETQHRQSFAPLPNDEDRCTYCHQPRDDHHNGYCQE